MKGTPQCWQDNIHIPSSFEFAKRHQFARISEFIYSTKIEKSHNKLL